MSSCAAAGWSGFFTIATVEIVAKVCGAGKPVHRSLLALHGVELGDLHERRLTEYSPAAIRLIVCV